MVDKGKGKAKSDENHSIIIDNEGEDVDRLIWRIIFKKLSFKDEACCFGEEEQDEEDNKVFAILLIHLW